MKKLAATAMVMFLVGTFVGAQDPMTRLFSRPEIPPRAALDRLNLQIAWRTYIPTESRRDGYQSVQFAGPQMFVQTRSGTIVVLNAATGATQWRANLDEPYRASQGLGFNTDTVFALRGPRLYALDRATGRSKWDFDLPSGPAAPPAADEQRIYLPLADNRVYVYELPKPPRPDQAAPAAAPEKKPDAPAAADQGTTATSILGYRSSFELTPEARRAQARGLEPRYLFSFSSISTVERTPLLAENLFAFVAGDGTATAVSQDENKFLYQVRTGSSSSPYLGQHHNVAYLGASDANVYALDLLINKMLWRVIVGSPVAYPPGVTDDKIYVVTRVDGLHQINRERGEIDWQNPSAVRFLATNPKFVYALDGSGRLLILDRAHGTPHAVLNARDFVFPISNEWTDRIFLAANDGALVCLHDKDYPTPIAMKKLPVKKAAPAKPADKGEGKPPEKPAAKEEGADKGEDKGK